MKMNAGFQLRVSPIGCFRPIASNSQMKMAQRIEPSNQFVCHRLVGFGKVSRNELVIGFACILAILFLFLVKLGDWQLECSLNGEPLDHDGWTYAIDFPAKFYPKKSWNTYVRRRKWVRTRRYNALNSWCAIAPLHKDATQEPFVDVAIGCIGNETSQSPILSVWAVSAHGRVMHRSGVSMTSPEGQRWLC